MLVMIFFTVLSIVVLGAALVGNLPRLARIALVVMSPFLLVLGMIVTIVVGSVLRAIFGRLLGATMASGIVGVGAWLLTSVLLVGVAGGVAAFIFVLAMGSGGGSRHTGGPWMGGGGFGRGGGGGGGWSGGGGGFGGGGASGGW